MTKKLIQKFIIGFIFISSISPFFVFSKNDSSITKYYGKILIQSENNSNTWYVDPLKKEKFPLNSEKDAVLIMKKLGVGISNKDIARIKLPTEKYSNWRDYTFAEKISGRIFVQVQDKGQAWYIDTINLRKYYLGSGETALKTLKNLSIKVKESEIEKIKTGTLYVEKVESASIENNNETEKEIIIAPETRSLSLIVENANNASGNVTMIQNDQNITYTKKDFVKTYVLNSDVTLYAISDYGYEFIGWGGDCASSGKGDCKVVCNENLNVIAYFSTPTVVVSYNTTYYNTNSNQNNSNTTTSTNTSTTTPLINQYNLNISKLGSGSGYITNSVRPNHYSGSENYDSNTQISLTVNPNNDSIFLGWTGEVCSGNLTTCTFNINSNVNVMANFGSKPRIRLSETIGGSLNIIPNKDYFEEGEKATITATPISGYTFTKWLGDCVSSGSNSTCILTMNGSKTVSALFSKNTINIPTVSLTLAQTTGGSVSSDKATYNLNEKATIIATPISGYTFTKWLGDCVSSGSNSTCILTMNGSKTVSALFSKNTINIPTVSLTLAQTTGGSVSSDKATYNLNEKATIIATPISGYTFTKWLGDCVSSGSNSTCILTMNGSKTVSALFSKNTINIPTVSLTLAQTTGGSVSSDKATYNLNEKATIIATPISGYTFTKWLGDCVSSGSNSTCILTMNGSKTVSALFSKNTINIPTVSLTLAQTTGGSVSSDKATYNLNEKATIIATPISGYTFTKWLGDCVSSGSNSTCILTMNGSKTVSALFSKNTINIPTVSLTLAQTTGGSVSSDKATYNLNEKATIIATPISGYTFTKWLGDCVSSGSNSTCILTMNGSKTVSALFSKNTINIPKR